MDATQVTALVREYFDKVLLDTCPNQGFETIDISRFDFKEWEVECRVFSCTHSKMVDYKVIISDDRMIVANEV